jgi:hypothetical protein
LGIWTVAEIGLWEFIVMTIDSPPGPLPKNCGFWEVIVSPSFKLSKITLVDFVAEDEASTLNLDD